MGDYGFAVSQKGYDVKTCADRKLVFSSSFQTLKVFIAQQVTATIPPETPEDGERMGINRSNDWIARLDTSYNEVAHNLSVGEAVSFYSDTNDPPAPLVQGQVYYVHSIVTSSRFKVSATKGGSVVDLTDVGSGIQHYEGEEQTETITVTHNLGYYAPYLVMYNGSSSTGTNASWLFADSDGYSIANNVYGTTTTLNIDVHGYFDSNNSNPGDTVYFTIYQFIDDFSTLAERTINTSTTSGSSSTDYGLRISKDGYDVKTCDDVDCVVSSSTPTHIVHKKGSTTLTSASHNLGYIPAFFSYYLDGNDMYWNNQGYITTTTLDFSTSSGTTNKYIILKNG